MILIFLLFALFASVFTVGKTALEFSQPFFLVGTRMLFAGIILFTYEYFKNPQKISLRKQDLWPILKLATFNIYLTNTFEFWGLQYLPSFKTCFIYSLSPFASALISYFVFSETMTKKKWLGLIIGCLGFLPILFAHEGGEDLSGRILFFSWAEIAVLLACISSVYGWILLKHILKNGQHSPLFINGVSMMIGGLFALIHSGFTETWSPIPVTNFFGFVECWIALIVVSNFVCYNLYGYLLKKYSATFLSFAGFTTPMFTAIFGWVFLSETINIEFYFSAVIVFSGLYLFNQEELKLVPSIPN
ncbi:MAG: DMT family transporter [Chlamydiota bacterium]